MAIKNFRDLMPDLETTDSSTDVHVSKGADPVYHCRNSNCSPRDRAYVHPRIIPLNGLVIKKCVIRVKNAHVRCVRIISDKLGYWTSL